MGLEFNKIDPKDLENYYQEYTFSKIAEQVLKDESKNLVANPIRFEQMEFVYNLITNELKGQDVKTSYKICSPFKTMGSISIEGKVLSFKNGEMFARCAEFANNTEVYPLVNGKVRLTFTFHGITVPFV